MLDKCFRCRNWQVAAGRGLTRHLYIKLFKSDFFLSVAERMGKRGIKIDGLCTHGYVCAPVCACTEVIKIDGLCTHWYVCAPVCACQKS